MRHITRERMTFQTDNPLSLQICLRSNWRPSSPLQRPRPSRECEPEPWRFRRPKSDDRRSAIRRVSVSRRAAFSKRGDAATSDSLPIFTRKRSAICDQRQQNQRLLTLVAGLPMQNKCFSPRMKICPLLIAIEEYTGSSIEFSATTSNFGPTLMTFVFPSSSW